ncbi:DBH-like monooxygenase protein 2 homolog isoform X1 [Coregonus clupeaformis]|uniref:DBH-like monooxygenase protein 2 homolog isoform X1 n=2 Tax=Coregonus clupeaformis TaxID=59861 RepID=UPI001BDFFA9B|nr:DBH-like monooxygenase protein 2 homolog isoform X1 [Coregonus clupeaformis]
MIPLLLSLLLAWPPGTGAQQDPLMPFMEHLDTDVILKWGFSEVQGTIMFQLTVKTTGWLGFGFSPNGGMAASDIVIGGVGPNGTYFMDYHATGNSFPLVDKKQSYTLLSLIEADGQTTMTFWRSIYSCDEEDFHITEIPVKLIYAYGTSDDIRYHANRRGTKEVNLLKFMPKSSPPDSNYLDFVVENVTVPAEHTYYHCKIMKVPKLNGKNHIYRIEPVIEHLDLVHHMLLYGCPSSVNQTYEQKCYMGVSGEDCIRVVSAWGVGGGAFELPEKAGIPIGGQNNDEFYRLEIHYNNPAQEAGRRDSSGLRLYYTAQLRQHDVGIMTTGLLVASGWGYAIPPNATAFHSYGLCNTSHFSDILPDPVPDLSVFSVVLHTHLAGRKVRAGHIRNGEQIDFLGLDENFNFEMQQATNLGNIKTIKPGDEIVVECTYNTTNRKGITQLGLATTDEMCLAFVFYYPAIPVTSCCSHPNMRAYMAMMGKTVDQDIEEMLKTAAWDQASTAVHEVTMKRVPQIGFIIDVNSNYTMYEGNIRNMTATLSVSCRSDPSLQGLNTTQAGPLEPFNYNTSSRGSSSWVVTSAAGSVLLMLWMTVL